MIKGFDSSCLLMEAAVHNKLQDPVSYILLSEAKNVIISHMAVGKLNLDRTASVHSQ